MTTSRSRFAEAAYLETIAVHKKALHETTIAAWANVDFQQPEPNIVRDFIMEKGQGVDYLNQHFASLFNASQTRFVLKFCGVFTHQRPYVKRAAANVMLKPGSAISDNCELADLAWIAMLIDSTKTPISARATLFQAKMENKIDNQTQRWLYDFDEQFEYRDESFYKITINKSPVRYLPSWNDGRAQALQYLWLRRAKRKAIARLSPFAANSAHDFQIYLYRMLTFTAGKPIDVDHATNGDWSTIMNDLTRMGAGLMKKKPRGSDHIRDVLDYFNNYRSFDRQADEFQGEGGMSFVMSIVQDTEFDGAG